MIRRIIALLVLIAVVATVTAVVVARAGDSSNDRWADLRDRLGLDDDEDVVKGSGYLEGRQVNVAADMSARVVSMTVAVGDAVGAGDDLLALEDGSTSALQRQAEAAVEVARARLDQLTAGAGPAQIGALEDGVDQARLTADTADRAWRDARARGQTGATLDALQTRTEVAQAAMRLAEAQLAFARAGGSPYRVAAAEAGVRGAEARLRGAGEQVARLRVRAPITGTVTTILVGAGETVSQGQTLVRVARLDPLELVIYVPEADLDEIEVGQEVDVDVDGYDDSFEGEVVAIAQRAEFTPKNVQTDEDRENLVFAVTIRVPNEDGDLRPGIPADATIDVG